MMKPYPMIVDHSLMPALRLPLPRRPFVLPRSDRADLWTVTGMSI